MQSENDFNALDIFPEPSVQTTESLLRNSVQNSNGNVPQESLSARHTHLLFRFRSYKMYRMHIRFSMPLLLWNSDDYTYDQMYLFVRSCVSFTYSQASAEPFNLILSRVESSRVEAKDCHRAIKCTFCAAQRERLKRNDRGNLFPFLNVCHTQNCRICFIRVQKTQRELWRKYIMLWIQNKFTVFLLNISVVCCRVSGAPFVCILHVFHSFIWAICFGRRHVEFIYFYSSSASARLHDRHRTARNAQWITISAWNSLPSARNK